MVTLLAAAMVATAARRARALSSGGALAATTVGGAVIAGAGIRGGAALLTFFLSSTLLGQLPRSPGRQRRGNERDAVQVLANGGVAACLALAMRRHGVRRWLLPVFAGALATATADTWATEIGSRLSLRPRSIVTGQPVPTGTSGGVSLPGILASASGAAAIGAVMSAGVAPEHMSERSPFRAVAIGGFCGAMVDSVLGATAQEVRFCDKCRKETELPRHWCGAPTTALRGISWFSNDLVNGFATLAGASTAAVLSVARSNGDSIRPKKP